MLYKNTHFDKSQTKGGSMEDKRVNPDLLEERRKCNFSKDELRQVCCDPEMAEQLRDTMVEFSKHPELQFDHSFLEMSREEQMAEWWKKLLVAFKQDPRKFFYSLRSDTFQWFMLHPGTSPLLLHFQMFHLAIEKLADEEQRAKWLPQVNQMKMVGCYAQTELGHGSNVAGLETTATFDKSSDELVLHTPTVTATKFWPGSLGRFGNHAVVFARLLVDENDFGVQPFLVQIRDFDTHKPLSGVQVGDIGAKLGYGSKDNGWLIFNQKRIPRTNMLMRFAGIDNEGNFEIRGDLRALYQIMVAIRQQLITGAGLYMIKTLRLAIRYSVCRRQFSTIPGSKEERKILDYQSHMFKLGPALSDAYMMIITGKFLQAYKKEADREVEQDNFKKLDILHHFTSGFKSLYTQSAYEGIDLCRQACGGAGYSAFSGLPQEVVDYAPMAIFEGDNTVMAQQNAKYIIKKVTKAQQGKKAKGLFTYFNNLESLCSLKPDGIDSVAAFTSLDHLETALAVRAAYWVRKVVNDLKQSNEPEKVKINDLFAQNITRMSKCHMWYLTFLMAKENVAQHEFKDPNVKATLEMIMKIFALNQLMQDGTVLYETGYFKQGSSDLLSQSIEQELQKLRPLMVSLVEVMDVEGYDQGRLSCIGNEYGDIYETQLTWAMGSKLNRSSVPEFWESHMKPIYHGHKL